MALKETEAMVHYIKTNAHLGSKAIAINLDLKVAKVVHIAHRHRVSLRTNVNKNGRKMKATVNGIAKPKPLPKVVLPIDHPEVIKILA